MNPYRQEIARLRATRPPTPYVQIAKILKERHGMDVSAHAIWAFVKARSKGRKVYAMQLEDPIDTPEPPRPLPEPETPDYEPPPEPSDGLTDFQRRRRKRLQQEKENPRA